jgi:hypothetical protein
MKTSAIWAAAAIFAAAAGTHGSCLAGEKGAGGPRNIIDELARSAVTPSDLTSQHARGSTNINVNTTTAGDGASFTDGTVRGNAVIGSSTTGLINTTNSVNNNMGITTVFQNSGNNSLFQQSTAITITIH